MEEEAQPGFDPDLSGTGLDALPRTIGGRQPLLGLGVIGPTQVLDYLLFVEGGDIDPVALGDRLEGVLI